jgi:hypothetical protein
MASDWKEHAAIATHYGDRRAQRSGVPLIRHIDEGLWILRELGASERAQRAYCLHPLLQGDDELRASYERLAELTEDPRVLVLALEYRRAANAALSTREDLDGPESIALSPLEEVNDMLRADKVQNRKDFLRHHLGSHPRSDALDRYFKLWLERLGISEERFNALRGGLDEAFLNQ